MTEGGNPKNITRIYDEYDDATKGLYQLRELLAASGEIPLIANVTGSVLLVDASNVEEVSYAQGATIYIQVSDADRNADVNTAETVTVTVTSETSSSGEVTLTETGVSTGVFWISR